MFDYALYPLYMYIQLFTYREPVPSKLFAVLISLTYITNSKAQKKTWSRTTISAIHWLLHCDYQNSAHGPINFCGLCGNDKINDINKIIQITILCFISHSTDVYKYRSMSACQQAIRQPCSLTLNKFEN